MAEFLMMLAIVGAVIFHLSVDIPRLAFTADTSVQGVLDRASQAAAAQYIPASLAANQPQIDAVEAEQEARRQVARGLYLDPVTLAPQRGSPLAAPPTLAITVYNGPFPFSFSPEPGRVVTLTHPGVILLLDAEMRFISPPDRSQPSAVFRRFAVGMWLPKTKP